MKIALVFRGFLPVSLAVPLMAQTSNPTAIGSPTGPSRLGSPSMGTTGSNLNFPDQLQRPLFLSGKVMMEDGTPPPEPVLIHLLCGAYPRPIAYTDGKGFFSSNISDKIGNAVLEEASDPFSGEARAGLGANGDTPGTTIRGSHNLMGCMVQASLAGFRSTVIDMGVHQSLDNPDIGTLFLHRLANADGITISATSGLAPKDAKKALEKARNAELKSKWPEAEKELQKAVAIYPKYAAAWLELGNVQQKRGNLEDARTSYNQAIAADPKFVSPMMQLALVSVGEKKWQAVADQTDQLLRLNPVDFPQAWMYNALANYNLNKMDLAEKSAREGLSRDAEHHYPTNQHVLGLVLAEKHDYPGSVQNLRDYLHYAPRAPDSAEVRKQLDELEKAIGSGSAKP